MPPSKTKTSTTKTKSKAIPIKRQSTKRTSTQQQTRIEKYFDSEAVNGDDDYDDDEVTVDSI
jgi:hypothetical protein